MFSSIILEHAGATRTHTHTQTHIRSCSADKDSVFSSIILEHAGATHTHIWGGSIFIVVASHAHEHVYIFFAVAFQSFSQ